MINLFWKPKMALRPSIDIFDYYGSSEGLLSPHNTYNLYLKGWIARLEDVIWLGKRGVADQVAESLCRGQSGKAGEWEVMMWSGFGRTMCMFQRADGDWFSTVVQTDKWEGKREPSMGLHARSMSDPEIREAIREIITHFKGVKDDDKVSLG